MKWLKRFKEMLEENPDISDPELFRAFPELKTDQQRLSAALLYWRYDIVAEEFVRPNWWEKLLKYFKSWL